MNLLRWLPHVLIKLARNSLSNQIYRCELKWTRVMEKCTVTDGRIFDPERRHATPALNFCLPDDASKAGCWAALGWRYSCRCRRPSPTGEISIHGPGQSHHC